MASEIQSNVLLCGKYLFCRSHSPFSIKILFLFQWPVIEIQIVVYQIDTHMIFVQKWDDFIIKKWQGTNDEKEILTTYRDDTSRINTFLAFLIKTLYFIFGIKKSSWSLWYYQNQLRFHCLQIDLRLVQLITHFPCLYHLFKQQNWWGMS